MDKVNFKLLFLGAFLLLLWLDNTEGLECYACQNQDSNRDKCIKTTKQCEQHEDICMTTIRWGLPPYWVPYGDRMHYVSKDCDTRVACESKMALTNSQCKRDWYDDWACIECCSGDLCNYYVTLTASSLLSNITLLLLMSMLTGMVVRVWT